MMHGNVKQQEQYHR